MATKRYETVFIITPVLSEDQVTEVAKKFKNFLIENNATIIHEENWGLRKLAYQIQKKSNGFYYVLEWEYSGKENLVSKLELNFKRDERILRYLTVLLDKHAINYLENKRKAKKELSENSVNN